MIEWTQERIDAMREQLGTRFTSGVFKDVALSLLDEVERVPRWIAVTPETMPELGVIVLAHYRDSHGLPRCIRAMWHGLDDGSVRATDALSKRWFEMAEGTQECWLVSETVTHWQPLPAPPVLP